MLDRELEQTLNNLFAEAREQRHEFMTIEHLLFALLNNDSATTVLKACGANLNGLHSDLIKFIQENLRIMQIIENFYDPYAWNKIEEAFLKNRANPWGHQVGVSLNRDYKGKTPKQLRAKLIEAIESSTLVEFTFRDDDSTERNYYVDITSATGMEATGYDERGSSTIMLVEP